MKILPVSEITGDMLFNVGELRMVQAYRHGYLDRFAKSAEGMVEFIATTMELAIVNLVYRGIVLCEVGIETKKILFITLADTTDYLSPAIAVDVKQLGYFEK
jgi:hypothetical protein